MSGYLPLTVPHLDDLRTEEQIEIEAVASSALDPDVDLEWAREQLIAYAPGKTVEEVAARARGMNREWLLHRLYRELDALESDDE